MPTRTRTTRTFTISLPPQMAEQVERVAAAEHRTTSELFREAFRQYRAQRALAALDELVGDAEKLGNNGYGPEDVEQLVHDVRSSRLIAK